MNQLLSILLREISVKLKNKAFYLFVLFSPILFLIPILFSVFSKTQANLFPKVVIGMINSTNIVNDTINYRGYKFINLSEAETKKFHLNILKTDNYIGILDLKPLQIYEAYSKKPIKFHMNETDLLTNQNCVKEVESFINQDYIYKIASKLKISDSLTYKLANLKNIYPITYKKSDTEKAKKTATALAYIMGMLLYIIFILFNNNVLKGVTEEKNNKLAEVLSIFVKPLNLMLGKIIGLGFVSLIQLFLWIISFSIYLKLISWFEVHYLSTNNNSDSTSYISSSLESIKSLPIINLLIYVPLFFVLGFLLNGALTTILAIYSSNKNSNYLSFVGNILNILSIYFGMFAASNPDSSITKIATYIPFFSYLTIPTLMPYNTLSMAHILTSLLILVVSVLSLLLLSSYVYKNSIVKK